MLRHTCTECPITRRKMSQHAPTLGFTPGDGDKKVLCCSGLAMYVNYILQTRGACVVHTAQGAIVDSLDKAGAFSG